MSATVIIQTAFLGDLLLSIPLLKKTRQIWPEDRIILVCRKGFGDFFKTLGVVDLAVEIKKGDSLSYRSALDVIGKESVQRVISPHESLRTCFFVQKIKSPVKISFDNLRSRIFYTHRVIKNKQLPDALRQLSLVSDFDAETKKNIEAYHQQGKAYKKTEAGFLSPSPQWSSMSLREAVLSHQHVLHSLRERLRFKDPRNFPTVALFPGSVWATKRWTKRGYQELGRELSDRFQILVMGGPGEEELCAEVARGIPGSIDLCGQTSILESALILLFVKSAVGNDSASMHLGAVVEAPLVAIFGPTVIRFGYRPWAEKVIVVETDGLSCRPCGKHGHKKCPLRTHVCMEHVSSQQVRKAVESIFI